FLSAFSSYSCRVILYPLHSCRPVEAAPWVGSREALTSSSSSLVRASPLCPPSSPGIGTTCGGFLLGRMGIPAGLLSLSPPRALAACARSPRRPRAHAGQRAAPIDPSGAPRETGHTTVRLCRVCDAASRAVTCARHGGRARR